MSPNRPICCFRTVLACRPIVCRPKNNSPKRLAPNWFFAQPSELLINRGCRRLGEKPVGRKTFGRIIFGRQTIGRLVISKRTFRRKTVGRQRPMQFAFRLTSINSTSSAMMHAVVQRFSSAWHTEHRKRTRCLVVGS